MIYLTGDAHGSFRRIGAFCREAKTSRDDVLVLLGDAGINYFGGQRDAWNKVYLSELPVTLLCVHGNHERRAETIPSYKERPWRGGAVYAEDAYPNLLFARDGDVYDLEGTRALVIGGAYSVDAEFRIPFRDWWPDEQPSAAVRARVEQKLDAIGWKVDAVLTHTAPLRYEPTEAFLPGIDPATVDKSTERWLDAIERRLAYAQWFCGHYHVQKTVDRLRILYEDWTRLAEPGGS